MILLVFVLVKLSRKPIPIEELDFFSPRPEGQSNALLTCSAASGEARLGARFATIGANLVTKAESGRAGC